MLIPFTPVHRAFSMEFSGQRASIFACLQVAIEDRFREQVLSQVTLAAIVAMIWNALSKSNSAKSCARNTGCN